MTLRPLSLSADLRIVDDLDREVLLRGVNITSLGEYWQGLADTPPTLPLEEDDWAALADCGFSVIRLIVHWSLLEPRRGFFDTAYLDAIDGYVRSAARHGMYTLIDMHQDAYSAYIFTPEGEVCPPGYKPAKGWDGAPAWACLTEGKSTCIRTERNDSEAVQTAWNNFYHNTEGLRDEFIQAWAFVAQRFAGRSEVAGYDLLNEPEMSQPLETFEPLYQRLVGETLLALRKAESVAAFGHLLFLEPALATAHPEWGYCVPDPARWGYPGDNLVAAPHNYFDSIQQGGLSLEQGSDLFVQVSMGLKMGLWVGEYGWWDAEAASVDAARRFAADQDAKAQGGAWWQWCQSCGDPHSVPDDPAFRRGAVSVQGHLQVLECPGNVPLGPNTPLLAILSRPYPRAVPGRVVTLESDFQTGRFSLRATGATPGTELLLWTGSSAATHHASGTGLTDILRPGPAGGYLLRATVTSSDFQVSLSPDQE